MQAAVGRVGETIAYAWLMRHYPDVCSRGSWVSSHCAALGEPEVMTPLGYDFRIALPSRTLYFEVKATTGRDTRFELGESEVRKAADCARRSRDDYRVLFITNALDAQARQIHVLIVRYEFAPASPYNVRRLSSRIAECAVLTIARPVLDGVANALERVECSSGVTAGSLDRADRSRSRNGIDAPVPRRQSRVA